MCFQFNYFFQTIHINLLCLVIYVDQNFENYLTSCCMEEITRFRLIITIATEVQYSSKS